MKNPRGSFCRAKQVGALFLEPDTREFLLEPRKPPAAVDQLLLTAGPGRMRLRVDVEVQRVALLAPRAASGELGAVGHHHLDGVIVRMQVGFHGRSSCAARATIRQWKWRLYSVARQGKQVAARERGAPIATRHPPGHCRAGFGCVRSSEWPIEMNVLERDAARATGTAVDEPQPATASAPQRQQSRKLRPLLLLMPYIARYRWRATAALLALLIAAIATLLVPIAVRRMIDFGFSRESANLIDSYFSVMVGIVAVLALASAARFYLVTTLGERIVADLREGVFGHLVS